MKDAKKARVAHNEKKRVKNLELASGDRVPGTIDLASATQRVNKRMKKGQKKAHVQVAFDVATNSTASMGVFDKKSSKLEPEANVLKRSKVGSCRNGGDGDWASIGCDGDGHCGCFFFCDGDGDGCGGDDDSHCVGFDGDGDRYRMCDGDGDGWEHWDGYNRFDGDGDGMFFFVVVQSKAKTTSKMSNLKEEKSTSLKLLTRILNKSGAEGATLDKEKSANMHQMRQERQRRRK